MVPLYPEDGSIMFFRNVVTRTYLQNDTAFCATRVHHSACLPELRIQRAIRYYAVLLTTNKVLFPSYGSLYPEDGSIMFFRNIVTLPTYKMTRLPVIKECIILHACLNFEYSARFAITLYYCLPIKSCFHLMVPCILKMEALCSSETLLPYLPTK